MTGLCGITGEELAAMTAPAPFTSGDEPVPQPAEPHPASVRAQRFPERHAKMMAMPDDKVWDRLSETEPPVDVT